MKWIKTNFPGVRYREHTSRKHGVRRDRYFSVRWKVDGHDKEIGLGWESEWKPSKDDQKQGILSLSEKAFHVMKEMKTNARSGEGPRSLKEKRKIAEQKKAAEQAEKERREKEEITLKQFFDDVYYPIAITSKKKQTYLKEEIHFRLWINPVIGKIPLKKLVPYNLEQVKKRVLDAGKAPRTAQYIMATARQVWNMARREGLVIGDSPTLSVKVPKFDNRRQRFLSHTEADKLLVALKNKNEQVYQMALLSLHTGMRASEVFRLTWGCIDTERGIISILDAKSGKGRAAFMTEQVKQMLHAMAAGKNDGLVFPNTNGTPYTEIPKLFREVVEDLKFNENVTDSRQRVCFHTLRHCFGSWHAEGGTDLYVIKELLGHGSITLTERYSHLTKGTLQNATKTLEQAIKNAGKKNGQVVNLPQ